MKSMKLAGDRMMTVLLSELNRAGIQDITLDRDLNVLAITPKTGPAKRLLPRMFRDGKRADVQKVREQFQTLIALSDRERVYAGRTFSEALAFRLNRFFVETGDEKLTVVPGKYEVLCSGPVKNGL